MLRRQSRNIQVRGNRATRGSTRIGKSTAVLTETREDRICRTRGGRARRTREDCICVDYIDNFSNGRADRVYYPNLGRAVD